MLLKIIEKIVEQGESEKWEWEISKQAKFFS